MRPDERPAHLDRGPVIGFALASPAAPAAMRALGLAARYRAGGDGPPPWLLVHPGAGSPAKRWPAGAFAPQT